MSVWCRIGLHRWPLPAGVGYCERGCGALMPRRSDGRTWTKHVEPGGKRPGGLPAPRIEVHVHREEADDA